MAIRQNMASVNSLSCSGAFSLLVILWLAGILEFLWCGKLSNTVSSCVQSAPPAIHGRDQRVKRSMAGKKNVFVQFFSFFGGKGNERYEWNWIFVMFVCFTYGIKSINEGELRKKVQLKVEECFEVNQYVCLVLIMKRRMWVEVWIVIMCTNFYYRE